MNHNAHINLWRWTGSLLLPLLLNACITINIYFPAAAAEKAADKVIDEIWQTLPDGSEGNGATKVPAKSAPAVPPASSPASSAPTGEQP